MFAGWTYESFAPFSDAPWKGKKKINWKLIGKIALCVLGAIAVGVVVGVLVAGTGGAALAALPVVAKIGLTAKGIGAIGGAVTAGAGTAAAVKMGVDEHRSGDEYSALDYITNSLSVSMRSGAVVLTSTMAIACLPAAAFNATIGTGLLLGKGAMPAASVLANIGGAGTIGFFSLSNFSDIYASIYGKNPLLDTVFRSNEDVYRATQLASSLGTMGVMQLGAPIQPLSSPKSTKTPVIGRMKDLKNIGSNEYRVADLLPNQGNPQANWKLNSGVLRSIMNQGNPIRDASPFNSSIDPKLGVIGTSNANTFLHMERNLLYQHGWRYSGGFWSLP